MSEMGDLNNEVTVGLLGALAAIAASVVAFFGGKGSAAAQLQASLNKSMELMLKERKEDNENCERKLREVVGMCRNLEQHVLSLQNILRRHDIDVPSYTPVEVVFLPKEDLEKEIG